MERPETGFFEKKQKKKLNPKQGQGQSAYGQGFLSKQVQKKSKEKEPEKKVIENGPGLKRKAVSSIDSGRLVAQKQEEPQPKPRQQPQHLVQPQQPGEQPQQLRPQPPQVRVATYVAKDGETLKTKNGAQFIEYKGKEKYGVRSGSFYVPSAPHQPAGKTHYQDKQPNKSNRTNNRKQPTKLSEEGGRLMRKALEAVNQGSATIAPDGHGSESMYNNVFVLYGGRRWGLHLNGNREIFPTGDDF